MRDLVQVWDDTFIHGGNDGMSSNFAPQALANCGFLVLMFKYSAGPYPQGDMEGAAGRRLGGTSGRWMRLRRPGGSWIGPG